MKNYTKNYQGAEATVQGTVEKVDATMVTFGTYNKQVYKVYLQEKLLILWVCIMLQPQYLICMAYTINTTLEKIYLQLKMIIL